MSVENIGVNEMKKLLSHRDDVEIIDVREKDEYEIIHIKGSKSIPMAYVQEHLEEIDWNKEVVFVCRSGARSEVAANFLSEQGREIKNLRGGIFNCYKDGDCQLEILKDKLAMYF